MSLIHSNASNHSKQSVWDFHRQQSLITDPGRHRHRLATVAVDTVTLVESFGRMVLNFVTDRTLIEQPLFNSRLAQVDLRTVSAMLDALDQIAHLPLEARRSPQQRIVGNCRDCAVLCCAALRAHGIPARVRYGFAHHFYNRNERLHEHAVTEFADPDWKMVDCRLNSETISRYSVPLIPGQILSMDLFRPALKVWKDCREGRSDFADFSNGKDDSAYGMWYVSKFAYQDLASLNGFEPLMWDVWGPQLFRTAPIALDDPEELQLLDAFAAMDPYHPDDLSRMNALYLDCEMLRVPRKLVSYSPHRGLYKWTYPKFTDLAKNQS